MLLILITGTLAITTILSDSKTSVEKDTDFYTVKFVYDNKTDEISNIELISKREEISKTEKNSLFDMIEAYVIEKEIYEAEIKPTPTPPPTKEPIEISK